MGEGEGEGEDTWSETGRRVGRYEIRELLGAGGMAVVFAARDPELRRTVALKLLRTEVGDGGARARQQAWLRREARVLAQLAHPNVVAVHDVGVHRNRSFVAMEYVEGQTLASWLAATARSPREIIDAFVAAGRGLAAAHDAGIVHRDFKPENVLVGSDGRVRVADFGLARIAEVERADRRGAELTMPGTVLGTPCFMAPEQYRGEPTDARSDQFSFCVALFAAIYGVRPFAGDTLSELTESVCAGRLVDPPRVRGVEAHVAAAIRRGLATRAEDRFSSMADLLKLLARRSRRRAVAASAVGVAVVAIVAIVAIVAGIADDPSRRCRGAGDHLRGVWDDDRKAAIRASVFRTSVPYAAATLAEVTPVVDAYAAAWVAMRTSACEATQSSEALELRMMCLDQRLRQLSAFVGQLVVVDRASAEHAVRAVHELAPVDDCADVRALATPSPLPRDPARRRQVELAMDALAKIRAMQQAGQLARALAEVRSAIDRASELGHRPLEAESLLLGGPIADAAGDAAAAERWFARAALAAEAAGLDVALIQALVGSIGVVGRRANRFVDAQVLWRRAQVVLERIAKPAELESALLKTFAMAEWASGKLAEAKRDLAASLALSERVHGRDHLNHAETLHRIGAVLLQEERGAEARGYIERALAIHRRVFGDDHPQTARAIELLAGVEYMMSNYYVAVAGYQRAQAIYERVHGTDHARVANVMSNLANAYGMQGHSERSVAVLRRAVAIATKVLGATDPATLNHLDSLAHALVTVGNRTEARVLLDRVLGLQRAQLGADHHQIASTLHSIALLDLADGRPRAALEHAQQSYDMYLRTIGDSYRGSDLQRAIGDAHLQLGDPANAAIVLEAAASTSTDADDPGARAWLDSLLGQALVDSKRDPARGRELVGRAWAYLSSDDRTADQRAQLAAWMKRRGMSTARPAP